MNLDLVKRLKEAQGIKDGCTLYNELVKQGIIPISVNCWLEMYDYFNIRMIVNAEFKDCKSRSYSDAADKFKVSDMTIRRSVNFFKE